MSGYSPTTMGPADLFDTHVREVYAYVRRRTSLDDADDLVSEVFTVACRRIDEIPAGAELPWLYRTAWNLISNHWRKQQPLPIEQVPETADEFDDFADLVTESDVLRHAWRSLNSRDREILRLVVWEGVDGAGLAQALGISVSGAGAALWRARQKFQQAYESAQDDDLPLPRHVAAESGDLVRKKRPAPDIGGQR